MIEKKNNLCCFKNTKMTHTLIRLDENKNFVIPGINLRYEQNSMIVFIEIQLWVGESVKKDLGQTPSAL